MTFKRYTVRKFAIFAIVSLCSLVFAPHSHAQGNLQFNQVIRPTVSGAITYYKKFGVTREVTHLKKN